MQLQFVTTLSGGALGAGARITDFTAHTTASGTFLFAGAQPGFGMLAFALGAGQAAAQVSSFAYSGAGDPFGATDLALMTFGNTTVLLPAGRFPAEIGGPVVSAAGILGPNRTFGDGTGPGGDAAHLEVQRTGSESWLFGAAPGSPGIHVWRLPSGTTTLEVHPGLAHTGGAYLDGISDLVLGRAGGSDWLVAASATGNGVTAMRVGTQGALAITGSFGAADGLGIDAPAAVRLATVGGTGFAIVAGAGSSTLSVFRLDPAGLVPTDHVNDTLATRFQSVRAIETVTAGDRTFVIAGGADGGLTLFQLLPDGRLILTGTVADTAALALSSVSAIRAVAVGSTVQVFVASANENGLTQFTVQTGNPAPVQSGGAGSDTLSGGAADELILGGAGADRLSGGGGADILVDGAGRDTLTGGAGADLFVLIADGDSDRIEDFDPLQDRLDLSDFPLLYDVRQLAVQPTATGATLTFGGETVELLTVQAATLLPSQITSAMILNLPRVPSEAVLRARIPAPTSGADDIAGTIFDDTIAGGAGADTLRGGWGDDTLVGGFGADRLEGDAGADTASYADAPAGVTGDLSGALPGSGDAAGDLFVAIENLAGSPHADLLAGDANANALLGGGGGDMLLGQSGNDTLDGGDGDDTQRGGAGADMLDGGAGRDTADYSDATAAVTVDLAASSRNAGWALGDVLAGMEDIVGSAFADALSGDGGANVLTGGAGADTIAGGAGNDTILGGAGADRIDGGTGLDWATWAGAPGFVLVDLLFPQRNRGEAQGDMITGVEALLGTDFGDDLRGDALDNTLTGGLATDWLTGRAGNDRLFGGEGNDNLLGGGGFDTLDGGNGFDRVLYTDSPAGLLADLANPGRNTGHAARDVYIGVEGLRGSNFDDELFADGGANQIDGGAGNDRAFALGGNDWLLGRAGDDLLDGGDGNDILLGGDGADTLIGGSGTDRAHYGDSFAGLVADLADPSRNTGHAAGDVYSGIENLQGSIGNDDLRGDAGANAVNGAKGDDLLFGRAGDDHLIGAEGNDTLDGGAGNDLLTGGDGADEFRFLPGAGRDRVADFIHGEDMVRIDPGLTGSAATAADVIARFWVAAGPDSALDFGGGDVIVFTGITDAAVLAQGLILG